MGALAPLLLSPDNFTPPSRTPWGGTRIVRRYKAGLGLTTTGVVGESWELSVTPEFPSRLADGRPLAEVLAADPPAMLGREARRGRSATALLVKLLDTAAPLSVQIHPPHGHPGLEPSEAGKPESWYVLDAAPGAGVHLGLRRGVTPQRLRAAIDAGEDLSALLFFVPVEPGDVFLIRAGTAHAIGPGITLVEPQHVAPGRRGVTYRFWDWNRRYDATGRPDRSGRPRELHVEAALAVTDWDAPREDALLAEVRLRLGAPDRGGAARLAPCCGALGGVPSSDLDVVRLHGSGTVALPELDALRALTVTAGSVAVEGAHGVTIVAAGRTAALPAAMGPSRARLDEAEAVLSAAA